MNPTPKIIADKETIEQFMYITINGRLTPKSNEDYMKLCLLAYRFRQAVKHGINLVLRGVQQKEAYKELAKLLPSSIYGETAYKYAKLLVESAKEQVDDEIVVNKITIMRKWIASRGGVSWRGNLNVRLTSPDTAEILVFNHRKESRKITVNLRTPKRYKKLLERLIEKASNREVGYPARVVIKEYNFYQGNLHLYCGLQVVVPYYLYLETMRRYDKPLGNHVGGVDVNVDRINLAIVDKYGRLRDTRTFWFRETISRGYKKRRAWTKIYQAIHELLQYAYHHGTSTIALENPKIIGYLRYYWIRDGDRKTKNYNYKKSIFRNKIIDTITCKAPLYSLKTIYVNPKGTTHSKAHGEVMKRYGLDRHTASAYLIALKAIKRHTTTQKAII